MLASLICEPFVPMRFGVTGRKKVIISCPTAHNHVYPRPQAPPYAGRRAWGQG